MSDEEVIASPHVDEVIGTTDANGELTLKPKKKRAKPVQKHKPLRRKKKAPAKKKKVKVKKKPTKAAKKAAARKRSKPQKALVRKKTPPKSKPGKRGPKGNPPGKVKRYGDPVWGAKVAAKRIKLGMTQREAAAVAGILQPHWCNIERGTYAPSDKLRAKIDGMLLKHVGDTVGKKKLPSKRKEAAAA